MVTFINLEDKSVLATSGIDNDGGWLDGWGDQV